MWMQYSKQTHTMPSVEKLRRSSPESIDVPCRWAHERGPRQRIEDITGLFALSPATAN
jgi:hypothetical protein